jgi:hypothetical protein
MFNGGWQSFTSGGQVASSVIAVFDVNRPNFGGMS